MRPAGPITHDLSPSGSFFLQEKGTKKNFVALWGLVLIQAPAAATAELPIWERPFPERDLKGTNLLFQPSPLPALGNGESIKDVSRNTIPPSPVPPQGVGVAQGGARSPLTRGGGNGAELSPRSAAEAKRAEFPTHQKDAFRTPGIWPL